MTYISFTSIRLADGTIDSEKQPENYDIILTFCGKISGKTKEWFWKWTRKGVYCVRRCGFYKGNFSLHTKEWMKEKREYEDKTGCNGIPFLAFEGTYSECRKFIVLNQTYVHIDRN